ncbi:protein of unknown function DUF1573 [Desulfatibacillum aliphaticivorans]|uniref:DUF1573 domain-containing protein n=1 Tax=Desulfatibacillum aliphaticivorans TaxID=218208 RepID=B8FLN3_DESAL|nr:DUF1573 domain-containing protein [Desulfatibacillum aliphaticivorans]ACL05387.1 protein of unknown function DUF1573 [Desulfatibacillum aliphaticivorans]
MEVNRVFFRIGVFVALLTLVCIHPASAADAPRPAADGPAIAFDATSFDFEKALDNDLVTHNFFFTNTGSSVLEINQVKVTCGCTTTSYTRRTAPGEKGSVEIRVNTRGYGGSTMRKVVYVMSNAPANPKVALRISGKVIRFAKISPLSVSLNKESIQDSGAVGSVKIVPIEEYPFKITDLSASKNARFSYKLEDYAHGSRKGWILTVTDPKPQGRYMGSVYVHTDSPVRPKLEVRVYGNFTDKKPSVIKRMEPKEQT